MNNSTVLLKNYQAPLFSVEKIDLVIDLYDDYAQVENHMIIKRLQPGVLHLQGENLVLLAIKLNDTHLVDTAYQLTKTGLIIDDCPDIFKLMLKTQINPQDNTELSGLFRSNQLFCTQCEAEGFRRITFFPDRPDVLSFYSTKISADKKKYPVLLSNGNLIASGDYDNGRHWVIWDDPFKKPSYLFALVAGNLSCVTDEFVTCSGKTVALKIYVEPGNEEKCVHAMCSLKKAMRWDEDVYGREYDLSIFMIVAVSDFNMGAMENKGLNIFNAKYILACLTTATDQDFADVEGVIAHEYFHNWTGNRVTCRDWFQLSLKEGLTVFRDQEFSRDMQSRDVNRILDVKLLKASQFPEDAGSMAHPVRPSSYQEINNFYTATIYNKGAEVIRMQQILLGDIGFRQGMDLYFKRHDGQAVTIDDFIAAMQDSNGVDFSQFMHWYDQAGTPTVTVSSTFKANTLTLTLTQSCPPTPECQNKQPFYIPIKFALFTQDGCLIPLEKEVIELRSACQTVTFTGIANQPIVSLLRDFSAPIKLVQQQSSSDLLALLRFETNGYAKWEAAQQLARDCILSCLNKPRPKQIISSTLIAAFKYILQDNSLDMALKAELLTPPGFEDIVSYLTVVEVDEVETVRDHYRAELGRALFTELNATYQTLWVQENNAIHTDAYARRKLRNTCLWLMMKADETFSLPFVTIQFEKAGNMTDQLASFNLLSNCHTSDVQKSAITKFYKQWAQNELVLDKWFAIQASSEHPKTLAVVKSLVTHDAFSFKNPNKVRAVIGSFSQANPRHFHAIDGSGYTFLSDMIRKIDTLNPQIAARLATPFTRWQRYDKSRQGLILTELKRLSTHKLSNDLIEIITKCLTV